jgi:hypothetical protein
MLEALPKVLPMRGAQSASDFNLILRGHANDTNISLPGSKFPASGRTTILTLASG